MEWVYNTDQMSDPTQQPNFIETHSQRHPIGINHSSAFAIWPSLFFDGILPHPVQIGYSPLSIHSPLSNPLIGPSNVYLKNQQNQTLIEACFVDIQQHQHPSQNAEMTMATSQPVSGPSPCNPWVRVFKTNSDAPCDRCWRLGCIPLWYTSSVKRNPERSSNTAAERKEGRETLHCFSRQKTRQLKILGRESVSKQN